MNTKEIEIRKKIADKIELWIGLANNKKCPEQLVTIYNNYISGNPVMWGTLPRKTKMSVNYPWCACTVSCAAIECGYTDVIPVEMSCGNLIKMAQMKNIWCEDESNEAAYEVGNLILYDWDDGSDWVKDCVGSPEHVGMITRVEGDVVTVTEGNYSNTVKQRKLKKNARYIRGIITPDYSKLVTDSEPVKEPEPENMIPVINISRGAKGETVKALQSLLNGRFNAHLTVDGSFGKLTERAVNKALNKYRMVENGVCNVSLWNHLING